MHTEAWLIGALLLMSFGFSAATIAYQALGADCGSSSQQRTQLTAAREGFSLLGVVLAAALPSLIAIDLNMGIARLAWIFPALLIVAAAVTLFGTNKFAGTEAHRVITTPRHEPLLHSVRKVFADAVFRRLLAVFLINGIAAALPSTLFLFFVADVLQVERASGALLALYFIAGAMSLPLWVRLAARYGRVAAWFTSMLLSIIAFAGTGLLSSGDLGFFVVICLASGLALGADLTLPAAIAADLGERHGLVGAYFGVWNFVAKLNLALAAGLALPLLGALGYIPGGSAELTALVFAYALLPLIFKTLAGALLWRWRQSLEVDL
jgi:glycoside/pentoside/hexuronide:cation symporter, GPH family